jgi:hypothetical protein
VINGQIVAPVVDPFIEARVLAGSSWIGQA